MYEDTLRLAAGRFIIVLRCSKNRGIHKRAYLPAGRDYIVRRLSISHAETSSGFGSTKLTIPSNHPEQSRRISPSLPARRQGAMEGFILYALPSQRLVVTFAYA
ncbi:MAG: hypothetical protein Q8O30_11715 [Candidatus Omnitrophota bacterium]|nr:hypothetical protein [Candidatus Omnitrophota bacterium]